MKRFALIPLVLLGAACGGSSGGEARSADSADALCRDWCTCTGDANTGCLDQCVSELLSVGVYGECRSPELVRYRTCMIDVECMDPFDDCDSEQVNQGTQECQEEAQARCEAECSVQAGDFSPSTMVSVCFEAGGDCGLATQCAELVKAELAQGTPNCSVYTCVYNGGTSCVQESDGQRNSF